MMAKNVATIATGRKIGMAAFDPTEMRDAIMASAGRLGISPSDLATAISYETAGSFDPWKKGPVTQWGEHRGLIQFGEPQRKQYGVSRETSVPDQLKAVEAYLTDAGVKPGHGLLDVYSAINAGRVGRYGASDAHNGGAPGSVADKVASMAAHRKRANALLGLDAAPGRAGPPDAMAGSLGPDGVASAAVPSQSSGGQAATAVPMSFAPSGGADVGEDGAAAIRALIAIPAAVAQEEPPAMDVPAIRYASPAGLSRLRTLARAAARGT